MRSMDKHSIRIWLDLERLIEWELDLYQAFRHAVMRVADLMEEIMILISSLCLSAGVMMVEVGEERAGTGSDQPARCGNFGRPPFLALTL